MFSGWGIRTLSTTERRYNPIGYHLGTVWPHDNALAVAGFRRYGFTDELVRVMTGMLDAAGLFEHDRLPEVFAGFDRREYSTPVRYPVACHPHALSAGSIPSMLESALGLDADGFERRLVVRRPCLPAVVTKLTLDNVSVASAKVKLVFERDDRDRVRLADANVTGRLDIRTED